MNVPTALAAAVLATGSGAPPPELSPYASGRAWFVSATGDVQGTSLEDVGVDEASAQPEAFAGLRWGPHHVRLSYAPIQRESRGITSGSLLGLVQFDQDVSFDLEVEYVRGRYGYRLAQNEWFGVEPFLEVGYLLEDTRVDNLTTGQSTRSDESAVFPIPGAEAFLFPESAVRGRAQLSGIGDGNDHLLDFEVSGEAAWRWIFGAVGYRLVDFRFETDRGQVADVELSGVFVEGGVRF